MKKYVTVLSSTDDKGIVTPLKIIIGNRYWHVKVLSSFPVSVRGGTGITYNIAVPMAHGQYHTRLYYEIPDRTSLRPRWFVDAKNADD